MSGHGIRLAALIVLWLPAAAGAEPPDSGQALYTRYCASCHGPGGAGDGPLRPVLRPPPADLTRIAEHAGGWFPDAVVQATIDGRFVAHGTRDMPVWGDVLDQAQISLLTEHLYSLQEDRLE